ncbi:hypothetical protein K1W54_08785 [Micromonospora sp. CPCC 205371]|nr:hypothetical protein [Micromonospora sp. CPCC 205371]
MAISDGWYLAGPVIALAVVGVLAVVLRRALGQDAVRHEPAPVLDDFGLLRVAALADRLDTAAGVRSALTQAGIRSTMAVGMDGLIQVLVFPDDAARARQVLDHPAPPPA